MGIFESVVAGLIVAAVSGGAGYLLRGRRYKKAIIEAPRKYVEHLGALIEKAMREGRDNSIVNARAIVAARDTLRGSLVIIADKLNSEIDTLASESRVKISPSELFSTIQVLHTMWRSRKTKSSMKFAKYWLSSALKRSEARAPGVRRGRQAAGGPEAARGGRAL